MISRIILVCVIAACSTPPPRDVLEPSPLVDPDVRTVLVTMTITPDGGSITVGPDVDAISAPQLCHDQLCGMDSYCSCHPTSNGMRCWSAQDDCEVDAVCCAGRPGYCDGLRMDDCADATVKARKARDKGATP